MNDYQLPELPKVPKDDERPGTSEKNDDIDFDDLMKRFEDLKKKK